MLPPAPVRGRTRHPAPVIRPPLWLATPRLRRLWWLAGIAAAFTAASESGVGLWLRHFGNASGGTWLLGLSLLLLLRLGLSALRDLAGEHLALGACDQAHASGWRHTAPCPQEHLTDIEAGTRAALQLRTGMLSLLLLLPTMAVLAPALSLGALLCALLLGLASRRRAHGMRPLVAADLESRRHFESQEHWARRALPEVRVAGLAPSLARLRRKASLKLLRLRLHHAWRWQGQQTFMELAAHAASLGLCSLAFLQWQAGGLPLGRFLAFLALALLAYRPVREAGRALPALARLQDRGAEPPPMPPSSGTVLHLDRVAFRYQAPLFTAFTATLEPGQVALLHGPNGCGKTTLLRLCAGDLKPDGGDIERPAGRVHWVDQETVLPPFTLRRWTGCAAPPALPAVRHFLETHVAPFLPGLDWNAPIPDGGQNLSRGQRIRLRLAALACSPGSLWLLDEPLSALPRPERIPLLQALLACRQGATVLISDQELPDLETQEIASTSSGLSLRLLRT